jgi:hypothetical protein
MQKNDEESAEKHRLVHSSFRIKENVSKALEREAQRRGVTNSSLQRLFEKCVYSPERKRAN